MMQPAAQPQSPPNQNMMAFLQAMQQARQQAQQPQQPQMPPQGMPPQGGAPMMPPQQSAQGGMPPGGASMPPQGGMSPQGMHSPMPQQGGQPSPQQMQAIIQLLSSMGRGGDSLMAHLTPGEVAVPPEVQTPRVLADLKKAFEAKGVSPAQFVAGSPQSSHNPQSGAPEYNFMSAFLPAALGMAGAAAAAPFTGGASLGLSAAELAAIGGGLGTAAGGLAVGQTPTQAALSGLGAGAGGYALGSLGGAAADAAGGSAGAGAGNLPIAAAGGPTVANANAALAPQLAQNFASNPGGIMPAGMSLGAPATGAASGAAGSSAGSASANAPGLNNLWGNLPNNTINPMRSIGSAVGGYVGGQIGAPPKPTTPYYPPGFNTPMTPVSQLPSAQTQLGQNTSKMPTPNFTGYNPATNNPAAFNFFPSATSGA